MRSKMLVSALAILAVAAFSASRSFAGKISAELDAQLNAQGRAKVIVFFNDTELNVSGTEGQEQLIRRLQRNLKNSRRSLRAALGASESNAVSSENWLSDSVSMTANRSTVERLEKNPAVKRINWDAPVQAARTIRSTKLHTAADPYTYGLTLLHIPEIRSSSGPTGKGVLVGQIDTGVDGTHPDLKGKIKLWKDFTSEASPTPVDTEGHGTHTAGTIVGGNGSGTAIGVAPDARLIVARGIGGDSSLTSLLNAMQWMVDPDGNPATKDSPVVCSMSWNTGDGEQQTFYEAIEHMDAAGVIPNFSAGNNGTSGLSHPHEHPLTFTSAAIDDKSEVADFSSRGPGHYKGTDTKKPEVSAPGVDVNSAAPGGGYQTMSGTSMATPHTAGVIALLFQANPNLKPNKVRQILTSTAFDLGAAGWDGDYGYGRLDAKAAVAAALLDSDLGPRALVQEEIFNRLFDWSVQ